MINFLLLKILLLLTAVLISFRFFKEARKSNLSLLFYSFFFFLSGQIIIQIFLGTINELNIFAFSSFIYAFSLVIFLLHGKFFWKNFKFNKINFSLLEVLASAFFFLFLIIEFYNALVLPVWEYDSISYHLPIINHFLQNGNLYSVHFSAYAGPVGYYPSTGNLLGLWYVLPLHSTLLANLQNFDPAIAFFISGLYFGKRLKMPTSLSVLFPLLFLLSPLVLKEIGTLHVDLFFSLAFLYLLIFLYEFIQNSLPKYIVLFATSLGLFLGTKYLAIPFAIIPIIIFLIYFLKNLKSNTKKYLLSLIPALILFVLAGGYWYIRNAIIAHNPIFPAELKIGGITIFEGYQNMTEQISQWSILSNLDKTTFASLKDLVARYIFRSGYQTFLIFISYLFLIFATIKNKIPKKIGVLFILIIPFFFFLYISAPYTFNDFDANIRYSLPVILIGSFLVPYVAWKIPKLKIVTISLSSILIILTLSHALIKSDLPHELFTFRYIFPQTSTDKFDVLRHKYPSTFYPLINASQWIDKNVPPETPIAYAGFHFHSPLFDKNLLRPVKYISVNSCTNCNYFDYKNSANGILEDAEKETWIKNLKREKIKYIVLYNESGFLKYEPIWTENDNQNFEKVFEETPVKIYELNTKNAG